LEDFGADEAFVWKLPPSWEGMKKPEEVRTFCWRIKDFGVVSWAYAFYFHAFHGYVYAAVAMWAGIEAATRHSALVGENSGFVEGFTAAVVGAF
jgi:hypothetical protein